MRKARWVVVIASILVMAGATRSFGQAFEVRSAVYEATDGSGKADVTEKVRASVKDGTLSLRVTNKDLGGDPTPGHHKRLRVEYAVDGKVQTVTVNEGMVLQIPPVSPWQPAAKLIPILTSDAPREKKSDACRQLAITGTKETIPVLAGLLTDEELSHMARYALQPMPDPAVDEAFRQALGQVKGLLLVGVINSIGVRRDTKAVAPLTQFLADPDKEVAAAAAQALGQIGTAEAVKALEQAAGNAPKERQPALYDGLLRCADRFRAEGKQAEARAIYDKVRTSQAPAILRVAATRGAILSRGTDGTALLVEQFQSPDPLCFVMALRVAIELPGTGVTQALAAELGKLPVERQPLLIQALAKRHDQAALPTLLTAAASGDKHVRLAAINALPEMGDPSSAQPLIALTTDPEKDVAQAAKDSLACLPGKGVDSAVAAMLDGKNTASRVIAIEVIALRRMMAVIPALLKAADDPEQDVRVAAFKALGQLGGSAEVAPLLELLMKAKERKDRDAAERALSSICARDENPDRCAEQVIGCLGRATPEQKVALLRILSAVGGNKALQAVCAAVKDPNADVHATAIRALGKWRTDDAADPLLELAKNSTDATDKLLCLRSYIGLARNRRLPAAKRLEICKKGQELIQRDDEKKLLLGSLGGIASPEALALVTPYLDSAPIKEEACAAVLSISGQLMRLRKDRRKNANTVIDPLEKAARTTANAGLKKRIDDQLKKAKAKAGRK